MKQRCRQEDKALVLNYRRLRHDMRDHILGQTPAEELIPESVGAVRIVVARQQMPADA